MATMQNPHCKPNTRQARVRQLLSMVQPQTEWEYRILEGHAHQLLNMAAAEGRLDRVHALLDGGARVRATQNEAEGEQGWTLLHHIIQGEVLRGDESDLQVVDRLLARPAVRDAINHCNDDGETALYLAVKQPGLDHACISLIRHGAQLDGSKVPDWGDHTGEEKKAEWQFLVDRPFQNPMTVTAYIQAQATSAKESLYRLQSLHTTGISRTLPCKQAMFQVLGWITPALGRYAQDPSRTPEMDRKLQDVSLRYLRWCTMGEDDIPRDVWLAERVPVILNLLDLFDEAGAGLWQADEGGLTPVANLLQSIKMPDIAIELDRLRIDRQTATTGLLPRPSPRL